MKRAFTVYVPDDCKLKMINICVYVAKEDESDNGVTVFTNSEADFQGDDKWLFHTKGKAVQIKEGD